MLLTYWMLLTFLPSVSKRLRNWKLLLKSPLKLQCAPQIASWIALQLLTTISRRLYAPHLDIAMYAPHLDIALYAPHLDIALYAPHLDIHIDIASPRHCLVCASYRHCLGLLCSRAISTLVACEESNQQFSSLQNCHLLLKLLLNLQFALQIVSQFANSSSDCNWLLRLPLRLQFAVSNCLVWVFLAGDD